MSSFKIIPCASSTSYAKKRLVFDCAPRSRIAAILRMTDCTCPFPHTDVDGAEGSRFWNSNINVDKSHGSHTVNVCFKKKQPPTSNLITIVFTISNKINSTDLDRRRYKVYAYLCVSDTARSSLHRRVQCILRVKDAGVSFSSWLLLALAEQLQASARTVAPTVALLSVESQPWLASSPLMLRLPSPSVLPPALPVAIFLVCVFVFFQLKRAGWQVQRADKHPKSATRTAFP